MSPRIQWIEHRGRSILYSDYAGLDEGAYLRAMDETQRALLSRPAARR